MPIEASAQIVITGNSEALKSLQGIKREVSSVAKEAKQAAKEQEKAQAQAQKAAEAAARAQQKAAKETARAQQKASQEAARAADKAQRDIERAAEKESRRWQELARKSLAERIRAEQAATRAAEQEAAKRASIATQTAAAEVKARRDALRRFGGAVGAVTGGVIAGATVAGNTGRAISGVKDLRERIASAGEYQERMTIVSSQAGLSKDERTGVEAKIREASLATGKDYGELLAVLETGQAEFNNLRGFADNLKEIAVISKASGADTAEFAKAMGTLQQVFGLNADQAREAAYLMKAAADQGSIEVKDFSSSFAPKAGTFASSTQLKGIEGVRQFLGAAQGVGTGKFGPEGSATRMEQAVGALSRTEVLDELKKIKITNVVGAGGRIDVASVIDQLASNKEFMGSAGVRQKVFSDQQARQGIEALLAARAAVQRGDKGAVDLRTISGVSAAEGKATVDKTFAELSQSSGFKMQQLAAQAQLNAIDNLDQFSKDALLAADASVKLEQSFGRLAPWVDSIAAAGAGTVATTIGGKMLGLGGDAAGGGALAKALPTVASAGTSAMTLGATAVGAASTAAIIGTVLAGAALGYGAGTLINEASGKEGERWSDKAGNWLYDLLNDGPNRATAQGIDAPALNANGEVVKVLEKMIRVQESIERKTGTGTKGEGGAPRGPR
jgi:hypothetical protein